MLMGGWVGGGGWVEGWRVDVDGGGGRGYISVGCGWRWMGWMGWMGMDGDGDGDGV